MTEQEALVASGVAGGLVGGILIALLVFGIIVYIISVIADWKIFTKAGEPGWKALIPIYNVYIFCKIIGVSFWIYFLAVPFGMGLILAMINNSDVTNVISSLYSLFLLIFVSYKLGKSFNKGTGFIIGLVIFPYIFQLVLAFGSSKYVGEK